MANSQIFAVLYQLLTFIIYFLLLFTIKRKKLFQYDSKKNLIEWWVFFPKNIMNICWIFDEGAKYQVLIGLGSIIKNNPNQDFNFYFIIPPNQTIDIHNYSILLSKHSTIYVKHFLPNQTYLSERSNLTCQWSNIIVVKIFLREILTNIDKVLYIDTDVMCVSPIHQLLNFPIERKTIAVPRRIFLQFNYINSGVVLYNLKYLRQKDENLWICANKRRCPVDDIWHTHCHGSEMIELPYRYNVEFHPMVHMKEEPKRLLDEESKACFYHLKDFYHNVYTNNISYFKNISLFVNNSRVLNELERLFEIRKWVDEKVKNQIEIN